MVQPRFEWLGEYICRNGREACERHIKAINEWGEIKDANGMRRFLGNFGWARPQFPVEYVALLRALTAQLRREAAWPMPAAAVKSQKALQELATQCVRLAVVDETAAISGERPLEHIADCSGFG